MIKIIIFLPNISIKKTVADFIQANNFAFQGLFPISLILVIKWNFLFEVFFVINFFICYNLGLKSTVLVNLVFFIFF